MKTTNKPFRVLESTIEDTCSQFLELDGWRTLKTNPVSNRERGAGFGEPGMADRIYIRYGTAAMKAAFGPCAAEVIWIEWKRAKGGKRVFDKAEKAKIHQVAWQDLERRRGAVVMLSGVSFPASIDSFLSWYENESGLNRSISTQRRKQWLTSRQTFVSSAATFTEKR